MCIRDRPGAVRQQPLPVPAAGRAGPTPVRASHPGGTGRRRALPPHRGAALPAHHRRAWLLLVPAQPDGGLMADLDQDALAELLVNLSLIHISEPTRPY